jgi:hypothetical protein
MTDIPRYRMTNNLGESDNVNGSWVRYEDHTVAVEAAVLTENIRLGGIVKQLHEIADAVTPPTTCGCPGGYVKEATASEPKFKVGDRVTHRDGSIGVVESVNLFVGATSFNVQWHTPLEIGGTHPGKNLTLYVPPTPAELIPTLKEHEWVWFKALSGKWEGPYAIYTNSSHDSILLSAGGYSLLFSDGTTSTAITEIKRCEAPVVK